MVVSRPFVRIYHQALYHLSTVSSYPRAMLERGAQPALCALAKRGARCCVRRAVDTRAAFVVEYSRIRECVCVSREMWVRLSGRGSSLECVCVIDRACFRMESLRRRALSLEKARWKDGLVSVHGIKRPCTSRSVKRVFPSVETTGGHALEPVQVGRGPTSNETGGL